MARKKPNYDCETTQVFLEDEVCHWSSGEAEAVVIYLGACHLVEVQSAEPPVFTRRK